jgi:hypothetical protein
VQLSSKGDAVTREGSSSSIFGRGGAAAKLSMSGVDIGRRGSRTGRRSHIAENSEENAGAAAISLLLRSSCSERGVKGRRGDVRFPLARITVADLKPNGSKSDAAEKIAIKLQAERENWLKSVKLGSKA